MKKTLAILLAALLAVSILASCSSAKTGDSATSAPMLSKDDGYGGSAPAASPSMAPAPDMDEARLYNAENGEAYNDLKQTAAGIPDLTSTAADMSEKIIYTINADIETVDFDNTINKVYAMLDGFGAFIENSYVGGRNYWQTVNGYQTYRNAWFTLRVPVSAVSAMTDSLSGLGSVTSLQRSTENITSQYIDTEARLKSYRIQEERLFAMMEKAEIVEDMLTIERYLADVRYEIEAMTTQLNSWQSRVDYSTLTLNINEVEKLSALPPDLPITYWQQVQNGLGSTLRGIGEFFKNLLKWVIVNSPVLAILAVIIVVIAVVTVKRRRAVKRMKQEPGTPPEDKSK